MTLTNVYTTRDALKRYMTLRDTNDDRLLDTILNDASRAIDSYCHRFFYRKTATVLLDGRRGCEHLLVPDLLSVTSLKTDRDGSLTYAETWATTDFLLNPINGPLQSPPRPYNKLTLAPLGSFSFPSGARSIQITGEWGFYDQREDLVSQLDGAITDTQTTCVVDDGSEFEVGMQLLIGSEQITVQGVQNNTLTITRRQNGTTATSHADNSPIQRFIFPEIQHACLLQAEYLYRSKNAMGGVMGSPDTGLVRLPVMQYVAKGLLADFRKRTAI